MKNTRTAQVIAVNSDECEYESGIWLITFLLDGAPFATAYIDRWDGAEQAMDWIFRWTFRGLLPAGATPIS